MNAPEPQLNATPSASGRDKTIRRALLEEAADLIDNDRNETYGPPTENFATIAELWTIRFKHLLKEGAKFTGSDYADAMILVKVARGMTQKTHDTYADTAGYAGCGEECRQGEQTPKPMTHSTDMSTAINDLPFDDSRRIIEDVKRRTSL